MYQRGYAAGVFDLFHVGHLRMLKRAREMCKYLIVAISSDELVEELKNRKPVIGLDHRMEIVEALGIADEVVIQFNYDKAKAKQKYRFDAVFIGSDHKGEKVWEGFEEEMNVVYLPYTQVVSTTKIIEDIHG